MDDVSKRWRTAMDDVGKKPAQIEAANLREVSEEDLKRILAAHETWVESDKKEGARAALTDVNLQGAGLEGANLQGANLRFANLQGVHLHTTNFQGARLLKANLQEANLAQTTLQGAELVEANLQGATLFRAKLQGADLTLANLQGADLTDANLRNANLTHANLRDANLSHAKLQGADLREADLQETDLRDANLQNTNLSDAKLSDVTGLFADKLAGANLSNAKLPEDIAAFDGLARVEEVSRIARPIFIGLLAGCVYSWLTIATTTDARLLTNSASSPLPIIGTEIPIAGFYWVAPILLLGVYLYLHLYLQRLWARLAGLPAVFPDGTPLDMKVYPWLLSGLVRAHFKLLKGKRPLLSRLENRAAIFLAWWIVPVTVLVFWLRYLPRHDWFGTGLHVALLVVSIGSAILLHRHAAATLCRDVTAFRWRRPGSDRRTYQGAVALGFGVVFALVSLGAIEGDAHRAGRNNAVIFGGPATWVPAAFDRIGYRTFANFRERTVSTRPEDWWKATSPEKELEAVRGATLSDSDLRYADAIRAFLVKADLRRANLQKANLVGADLQGAKLIGADLQGANLIGANLQGANLIGANLQGADLDFAKLQKANLGGANLQGADLSGANLQGADLGGANLQGADLDGANLQGADLRGAQNLTSEQLDEACGEDKTKLPYYLADYQMQPCPEPKQSPSN